MLRAGSGGLVFQGCGVAAAGCRFDACGCGLAHDKIDRHVDRLGCAGWIIVEREEAFCCGDAQFPSTAHECGERRSGACSPAEVVAANDGKVAGHGSSPSLCSGHGTECDGVGRADERGRGVACGGQQLSDRSHGAICAAVQRTFGYPIRTHLESALRHT